MEILLVCDIFSSEFSSAVFVIKNLQQLGHNVKLWDTMCMPEPPNMDFDICITWSNKVFDLSKIRAKKTIFYFLEDNDYLKMVDEKYCVENQSRGYDYFFTMNKVPGYEKQWMTMGCDEELHKQVNADRREKSVLFIGTGRDERRRNFVKELQYLLSQRGIELVICGNDWNGFPLWTGKAMYKKDFVAAINSFDIIINMHVLDQSPSDKVHAIIGCGGGLLINDNKEGYRNCYPMAPVWDTTDDLIEKIVYFLENKNERDNLVSAMQERCYREFTFRGQLKKILDVVQNGS